MVLPLVFLMAYKMAVVIVEYYNTNYFDFVAYELYKNLRSSINYLLGLSLVLEEESLIL